MSHCPANPRLFLPLACAALSLALPPAAPAQDVAPDSPPPALTPPAAQPAPAPPPAIALVLQPGITEGAEWDRAHDALLARPSQGAIAASLSAWRTLSATDTASFADYAGFLLACPGFPEEAKLRQSAEKALAAGRMGALSPARLIAFFDRYPPLANPARAQYALALASAGRPEAGLVARAAWRGGSMSDAAEAAIRAGWGASLTPADDEARLDSLLWDGNVAQALRALPRAPAQARPIALARIAMLQGRDPQASTPPPAPAPAPTVSDQPPADTGQIDADLAPPPEGAASPPPPATLPGAPPPPATAVILPPPPGALSDPGWLADRARFLLRHSRAAEAASLLASRPPLSRPALDPRRWIAVHLIAARTAGPATMIRIAEAAGEGLPPGTEVSQLAYAIRDDYTSLMWLAGTQALWWRGEPGRAAGLFHRYATASRTPGSRAKGFYWEGRALSRLDPAAAREPFEAAARHPDQFYGMLALEALHRPLPSLADPFHLPPTDEQRDTFRARPAVAATREVARDADWHTTIRFFRALSEQAQSEADFALLAELARETGRRDLGVIAGTAAAAAGRPGYRDIAFPLIPTPRGADWTVVHAVARQESQFSQNAISHSGARGLMQLMPGTAAEQARKLGVPFSYAALIDNPALNIATGNAYFTHLLSVYGGSWPLAAAAYNAGPGNVGRWLREIGDPRKGAIDWVDWIERIPLSETRGYVAHIVENAVVYEARNPSHARYAGGDAIGYFLRGK